jgi:hypothetical protein
MVRGARRRTRTRSNRKWVIELSDDGSAAVIRNGRQVHVGDDDDAALTYVRRNRSENDRVIQREPDGVEKDITRQT